MAVFKVQGVCVGRGGVEDQGLCVCMLHVIRGYMCMWLACAESVCDGSGAVCVWLWYVVCARARVGSGGVYVGDHCSFVCVCVVYVGNHCVSDQGLWDCIMCARD